MTDDGTTHVVAANRRFRSNVRWQFVANGSQAILGGLYLIALGRMLGPGDFGVFSAITAAVSVVGLFLELRLQEVVARDFCHVDSDPHSKLVPKAIELVDLLILEFLTRLIPMVAIAALSSWILLKARLPPGSSVLIWIAAASFLISRSGNSVSNGLLRVLARTDLIALCMASDWGTRLLLTVAIANVIRIDVATALWAALAASGICNIMQVTLACREYSRGIEPISLKGWNAREAIRRLKGRGRLLGASLGISCTDLMAKDLDVVLISAILLPPKVGLYKMSKSFTQVLWRAIDPFYISIMPEVQRLWQRSQWTRLRQLLQNTSLGLFGLSSALLAVGYLLLSLFGRQLLGDSYADVPRLMLTMSIWTLVCAPLIWGIPLAIAINRPEYSVFGSLLGLIVGLAAFELLTPSLGLTGSAIAWNATLIVGFAVTTGCASWQAISLSHRRGGT